MKNKIISMLLLIPIAAVLLLSLFLPGNVQGAAVVVDESMITYTPEEPYHSDRFNVTVDPLFIDAEPVEDGVVLWWSLCTDLGCGVAEPQVMTDNGDGTWSHEFDPFPEEDGLGHEYIDILFYIKITYTPTGGGAEATEQTQSTTVDFQEPPTGVDDDDDDAISDDDDDGDDSPFGFELVIAGVILAGAFIVYRRRTSQD